MTLAYSSRLMTILRILCVTLVLIPAIHTAGTASAAGKRGTEEEAVTEETESPAAQEAEQVHDQQITLKVYDLIREGSEDELRLACKQRGLPYDGDLTALRKRLIQFEMEVKLPPFQEKLETLSDSALILNHAEFIRYTEI